MGDKSDALVVMSNKDTYYVSIRTAQRIQLRLRKSSSEGFVIIKDIRTGAEITLNVSQISSVVIRSERDGVK
nr:MAG TPA: hypothetical protein [Caudoviricetes sp.]